MRAAVVIGFAALVLGGCGRDEQLGGAPHDAGSEATTDAPAPISDAGAIVRTIETRNPFGATDPGNLLIDGDFELTAASGQFGWRAVGQSGEAPIARETGGLCRSGLTCGILGPEADFLGFAAAPRDASVEIEVWAKPPVADCEVTLVSVINCTGVFVATLGSVPSTSLEPDASGWCRYQAVVPPIDVRPCLFVSSVTDEGQKTLVDQASLRATPKSNARALTVGPPTASLHQRIARALAVVHRNTQFGRARPSAP